MDDFSKKNFGKFDPPKLDFMKPDFPKFDPPNVDFMKQDLSKNNFRKDSLYKDSLNSVYKIDQFNNRTEIGKFNLLDNSVRDMNGNIVGQIHNAGTQNQYFQEISYSNGYSVPVDPFKVTPINDIKGHP